MSAESPAGETLWHGRFESGPSDALLTYTVSLPYDQRLAPYDIMGSRVHVRGLARVDLLTEADAEAVLIALDEVEAELASGNFTFVPSDEDIHTAVERRVTEIAGPAGARLHTGRSRNDQVATDLRLFVKDNMAMIARLVVDLEQVLFDRAVEAGGAYLPGYTHLQRAQPVLLSHHMLAHFWTFRRDVTRLMAARTAADVSPLGLLWEQLHPALGARLDVATVLPLRWSPTRSLGLLSGEKTNAGESLWWHGVIMQSHVL